MSAHPAPHPTAPGPAPGPATAPATAAPTTTVVELQPVDLDHADAGAIHGSVLLGRAIELETFGDTDLALDAATTRATMLDPYRRVRRLVAVSDAGRRPESVVGRAMVALPQEGNTHLALLYVGVHPAVRGRGVGTALWDAALAIARAEGRRVLLADAAYGAEPPPGPAAMEAPTGSGRVPRDHASTRFVLARGLRLEQVARHSVLDLPVPGEHLARLHRTAAAAVGDGYRVHVWRDVVPDRWLDDVAVLETRMSTDAPSGDLDVEEEPWDADRVRAAAAQIHERGQRFLMAAAEHVASGRLAAFSMVTHPLDGDGPVFQEDTLVLREHRGRRLGMLVKTSVLRALPDVAPGARRVHTWNAEENAHMLAINVALGFRPAGVEAAWQREI